MRRTKGIMKALLIVDVQNDFMPGGALAVPNGDRILLPLNRLQKRFAHIIATQDWHPPGHLSFAANHPGARVGESVDVGGLSQILWPVHCVQESSGAALDSRLEQLRIEKIVRKGADPELDSYSGFFDVAERGSTGLDQYLEEQGIDELFITGLALDYCVKFTALDALRVGCKTTVVLDCCRAVDLNPGDGRRAVEELRSAGARIMTAAEVDAELAGEKGDVRYEGRYLRIAERQRWEYAERTNCDAVVVLIAVHEGELLLTEQFRPPLGRTVLELPAGLVGDGAEIAGEPLENAASRELLEETGYEAASVVFLTTGPCSAGLTNETVHFFLAEDLRKAGSGGGVDGERIVLHRVPVKGAGEWLARAVAAGHCVDPKVYTALYFLQEEGLRRALQRLPSSAEPAVESRGGRMGESR